MVLLETGGESDSELEAELESRLGTELDLEQGELDFAEQGGGLGERR